MAIPNLGEDVVGGLAQHFVKVSRTDPNIEEQLPAEIYVRLDLCEDVGDRPADDAIEGKTHK